MNKYPPQKGKMKKKLKCVWPPKKRISFLTQAKFFIQKIKRKQRQSSFFNEKKR